MLCCAAKGAGGRNLWSAHRVASLKGVQIRTVASGCMACHSVVISTEGKVYSWGIWIQMEQFLKSFCCVIKFNEILDSVSALTVSLEWHHYMICLCYLHVDWQLAKGKCKCRCLDTCYDDVHLRDRQHISLLGVVSSVIIRSIYISPEKLLAGGLI